MNIVLRNAKFFGQFSKADAVRQISSSYFKYLMIRKAMVVMLGAFALTALFNHVFGVLFASSEEQMLWIATGWIVALVANKQPIWNSTISQYPCDAMCPPSFGPIVKSPITSVNRTVKQPTLVIGGLYDSPPELFGHSKAGSVFPSDERSSKWFWYIIESHVVSKLHISHFAIRARETQAL